jgi:hypothetical protein
MLVWWTNPDESAGNPLPACTRKRGHGVDVLADHLPVHQRLCVRASHHIGDIGATDRQRNANNHSENQAHVAFPARFRGAPVGYERGAIVKIAAWRSNRINRAAINLAQPISSTAIRNHPLSCGHRGLRGRGLLSASARCSRGSASSLSSRIRSEFHEDTVAIASGRLANTEAVTRTKEGRDAVCTYEAHPEIRPAQAAGLSGARMRCYAQQPRRTWLATLPRLAIPGSCLPDVSVASTVCADAAAQSNAVAGTLQRGA